MFPSFSYMDYTLILSLKGFLIFSWSAQEQVEGPVLLTAPTSGEDSTRPLVAGLENSAFRWTLETPALPLSGRVNASYS